MALSTKRCAFNREFDPSITPLKRYDMPFSAYDSDALRLLSAALSDALETFRKSKGRALTETETSDLGIKLTANLMAAFDNGEREPAALKRAALRGVYVASDKVTTDV